MNIKFRRAGRKWWELDRLFPSFSAVDVVEDEHPHDVVVRLYEFSWLTFVCDIEIPSKIRQRSRFYSYHIIMNKRKL